MFFKDLFVAIFPANNHLSKINNRNIRKRCEICSNLTIKTPEQRVFDIEVYLEDIPLPKLINEQALSCEGIISKDEVFESLKSIENNKSPGND